MAYEKLTVAFITNNRWVDYLDGLGITLKVAFWAAILGVIIGTIVAFMRMSVKRNGKPTFLSRLASIYIDVIRGTPSVLQLMIMWFIVLKSTEYIIVP